MPPKVKFSKETIIGTALQLVREQGMSSLTARALAEKLGATPRVIFGQFANMAELQAEVIGAAEMVVVEYIRKALEDEKPFRSVGVAYILFASKEPQLFQLLFQNPSKDPIRRFQDFLPMKDHSYQLVLDSIVADYPLTVEEAGRLYQHLFYLLTRDGLYGCLWYLSVQHGRSDWITDRGLSISHQRNGRKEMIQLENVHKSYGQTKVLKGIDLQIQDQDDVVILGPSGSGKSTLLNVLSGLEKVDEGNILIQGQDLSQLTDAQLTAFRREKIAFIFQQYYLLPNLTVRQNVKMGADLANNHDFLQIIEDLGLGDKLDKYPSELSGGEQQRVSIARALAKKPEILFLDEPTGALDEETGRKILDYIWKLKEKLGFTLIMVTHNQNIADMARTIIRVNSGKITEVVTNDQPQTAYEIGW